MASRLHGKLQHNPDAPQPRAAKIAKRRIDGRARRGFIRAQRSWGVALFQNLTISPSGGSILQGEAAVVSDAPIMRFPAVRIAHANSDRQTDTISLKKPVCTNNLVRIDRALLIFLLRLLVLPARPGQHRAKGSRLRDITI